MALKKHHNGFKMKQWILCFGQYYLLTFTQMNQNSWNGASQYRWTMTQSILWKQPRSGMPWNGQVNHLTWIWLSMRYTGTAGTECSCSWMHRRMKLSVCWCLWITDFRLSFTAQYIINWSILQYQNVQDISKNVINSTFIQIKRTKYNLYVTVFYTAYIFFTVSAY